MKSACQRHRYQEYNPPVAATLQRRSPCPRPSLTSWPPVNPSMSTARIQCAANRQSSTSRRSSNGSGRIMRQCMTILSGSSAARNARLQDAIGAQCSSPAFPTTRASSGSGIATGSQHSIACQTNGGPALVVPAGRSLGSCGRGRGRPSSVGRAPRLALIKLQSLRVWPAASRWRAFHLAVGTSGISGKNAVAFECQQMW